MKRFGYRSACAIAALAPVLVLALTATRKGVQAQAPRGKQLYDEHCAECHGETGRGDGPAAAMLKPRPRDFTSGKYKIRSTESGSVPTDSDLLQSVKQGLYGTSMPGWDHVLPDADITEVIAYIKSLSPQFRSQQPVTVAIVPGTPSSPESVSRGQRAYEKLQCGKCHGTDGRGTGAVTTT